MRLIEKSMKVHLSRFYEMVSHTYLYDTKFHNGIGYMDILRRNVFINL